MAWWFPLLLVGLFLARPPTGAAQNLRGTVVYIGDGDTIRVRHSEGLLTVRLACIDAPESVHSPYGQQARLYLQQRLPLGRVVMLAIKTTNRYGRTVAEVIDEVNLNLAMVEDGQAFVYRQYLNGCDVHDYLDAEYRASRRRYGVWNVEGGINRPWNFRHGQHLQMFPHGIPSVPSSPTTPVSV